MIGQEQNQGRYLVAHQLPVNKFRRLQGEQRELFSCSQENHSRHRTHSVQFTQLQEAGSSVKMKVITSH